jgi:flagellar biosynthesis regulator FlaF
MNQITYRHMEQLRFDPLDFEERMALDPAAARKEALAARKSVSKSIEALGYGVKLWTLAGQLRKYRALGEPCGRVRSVYYITVLN